MQYRTGTVTVTNGSNSVVGASTAFLANVPVGSIFTVTASGVPYFVAAVPDDTHLTLSSVYGGSTAAGQSYSCTTSFTTNLQLPYPEASDIDTHTIVKRAMVKIDTILGASIGSATYANRVLFTDASGNQTTSANATLTSAGVMTLASNLAVGGEVKATGGNATHSAAKTTLSYEGSSVSQIAAYGAGTGTAGTLNIVTRSSNNSISATPALFASTGVTMGTFTDGFITFNAAQINRSGGAVELQFGAAGDVKIFGNVGAKTATFSSSNGNLTLAASLLAGGGSFSSTVDVGTKPGAAPTNRGQLFVSGTSGPESVGGIELQYASSSSGYGAKIYNRSDTDSVGIATRFNSATWTERVSVSASTGNVSLANNIAVGGSSAQTTIGVKSDINYVNGFGAFIRNNATTGTNYGVDAEASGSGATENVGLYAYATGATTNKGIQIQGPTVASGSWALYASASAASYFSGKVQIGSTSPLAAGYKFEAQNSGVGKFGGIFYNDDQPSAACDFWNASIVGNAMFSGFYTDVAIQRGSIDYNRAGGVVRFNTTSDANLKTLIGDAPSAKSLEILRGVKMREWFWNADATKKPQIGPLAQELLEVYRGAVSVGGDEDRYDGGLFVEKKYRPWGVDKTAFVNHLVVGWQDLDRRLAAVEARR